MATRSQLRLRLFFCFFLALALTGPGAAERRSDRRLLGQLKPGPGEQAMRWRDLRRPERGDRRRGVALLRREACRNGLHVAVEGEVPIRSTDYLKQVWELGGARPVFAKDKPRREPGVVLHPGDAPLLGNRVRGELNPDLGVGRLHGTLDKRNEALLVRAVQPTAMARTVFGNDLLSRRPELQRELAALRASIGGGRHLGAREKGRLAALLGRLVELAKIEFPAGAFFKVPFEFQTGDAEKMITTANLDARALVADFGRDLPKLARLAAGSADGLAAQRVQRVIADECARGTGVIWTLLVSPRSFMVQEKLALARTPLGAPLEFRVDFVDGQAVHVTPRHSLEYLPEQGREAARFLESFFRNRRMPAAMRRLGGGADVAFTVEGKPKLIELNFGPESGYRDWDECLVFANRWMEGFTGRPTLMTEWFGRLARTPLRRQQEFFAGLPRDRLLQEEVATTFVWFRDRALDRWRRRPTAASGRTTLRYLGALAATLRGVAAQDDVAAVEEALASARRYVHGRR